MHVIDTDLRKPGSWSFFKTSSGIRFLEKKSIRKEIEVSRSIKRIQEYYVSVLVSSPYLSEYINVVQELKRFPLTFKMRAHNLFGGEGKEQHNNNLLSVLVFVSLVDNAVWLGLHLHTCRLASADNGTLWCAFRNTLHLDSSSDTGEEGRRM